VALAHPLDAPSLPVPPTEPAEEGAMVGVGSCALEIIHLAGDTPGAIALLYRDPEGPNAPACLSGGRGATSPAPVPYLLTGW
jgi:glyoxylase-like metal-dependent hydrolase (beta-lactamase superfamily II)